MSQTIQKKSLERLPILLEHKIQTSLNIHSLNKISLISLSLLNEL
jgi:hypothetical protein